MTLPEVHPPAWLAVTGVLAALLALFAALGAWQRLGNPHPELVRKSAHVGMGLVTLSFPWLFAQPLPVWVLCAGSIAMLAAMRWWRPLRPSLGGVMGRVERDGGGEFYFAFSVALVFWLSCRFASPSRVNLFFAVPMLILTLADAVGALVGVRYGQARYVAGDGYKSVEGSLAFFLVAFFSAHVPLLLWTSTGRAESLLIGLLLGLLVMLLEAVCGYGTDNFFVPLASFVALRIYLHLDLTALAMRLAILTSLTLFMVVWRRRTYLDDSAPLAAALVLYLSWSLGGWMWLLGPGTLLVFYTLLCTDAWKGCRDRARHNVDAVACVSSAGFGWLFAAWSTGWGKTLLFPFTLTFAAHAGIIALAHLREGNRRPAGSRVIAEAAGIAGGLVLLPYVLIAGRGVQITGWHLLVGWMAVFAATTAFARWQDHLDDCPTDLPRWLRQGLLCAMASLAGWYVVPV